MRARVYVLNSIHRLSIRRHDDRYPTLKDTSLTQEREKTNRTSDFKKLYFKMSAPVSHNHPILRFKAIGCQSRNKQTTYCQVYILPFFRVGNAEVTECAYVNLLLWFERVRWRELTSDDRPYTYNKLIRDIFCSRWIKYCTIFKLCSKYNGFIILDVVRDNFWTINTNWFISEVLSSGISN